MNFNANVSNTQSATFKGIKARYIAAVCGLALAAAAIAGIATYSSQDAAKTSSLPGSLTAATAGASADVPSSVYYLVGSQEQTLGMKLGINDAVMSASNLGFTPANYVIVADSPESQALVTLMVQDLNGVALQTGLVTANVIDLR